MSRSSQSAGPSNRFPSTLPRRPSLVSSVTLDNDENSGDNGSITSAVSAGKRISGSLVDALRRSTLVDNEESNLNQVLALAEELRDYQSPVEFTIGLVGDSGVGMW